MLACPSLSPRVFFLFLSLSAGSRASRMASVFIIPSLVDGRTRDKQSRHCLYMPINGRHPPPPPPHTHLVLSSCFDLPPPRLCCCSGSLLSTNRSLHAHVLLDIVYSYATHTLRKSEERERGRELDSSWVMAILSLFPSFTESQAQVAAVVRTTS